MISNEQALLVYALGDEEALDLILSRFHYFVRKCAAKAYSECRGLGAEFEDIEMTALHGLSRAIETYNAGDIPFAAFAEVVVERATRGDVRKAKSPTNLLFHSAVSLDAHFDDDRDNLSLSDAIGADDLYSTKTYMSEMTDNIEDFILIEVDEDEKLIVEEKIRGFSFSEVGTNHSISRRRMDAIIESLRTKAKILT